MEGLLKAAKLSLVNRLSGALLGMVKALCILAVLLNYITMFDRHEEVLKPEMKESSILYRPVYDVGNRLTASLKQFIDDHKEEWKEVVK